MEGDSQRDEASVDDVEAVEEPHMDHGAHVHSVGASLGARYEIESYIEQHNNEDVPLLETKQQFVPHVPPIVAIFQQAIKEANVYASVITTVSTCFLAFAVTNQGNRLNFNVSSFFIVSMVGSSIPQLDVPAAVGAYAGMVAETTIHSYAWLTLFAVLSAVVWQLASRFRFLVGCSGRLGTMVFLAMNVTFPIVAGSGFVPFDRYGTSSRLWSDVLNWENSVVLLAATIVGAAFAGYYRWHSRLPLNPVTAATFTGLLPMLIVMVTEYRYADFMIQGFAIGSLVGMASLEKVGNTLSFGTIGLFSGLWALFLQPFFVGFGGREGFLAFLGYATFSICRSAVTTLRRLGFRKPATDSA